MGPKALKGIAYGLLSTFVSRNNDIDGYWGLGVLRLFAETNGVRMITLDLLDPKPTLPAISPEQIAERVYHKWLAATLERAQIDRSTVSHANVSIRFTTFDEYPNVVRDARGEPYECIVTIGRADGTKYTASKVGVCASHDPKKERRSRILKEA